VLAGNVTLSQPLQSGYVESNNSLGDCCGGGGEELEQAGREKIWECQTGPGFGRAEGSGRVERGTQGHSVLQ
jgi:hypothetical protein